MRLFDTVLVTASSERQARAYRALLERRREHGLYPRELQFEVVADPAEAEKALRMLMLRYPEQTSMSMAAPNPADVSVFRVTPTVISVLDYSKGFAHTDLVTC
jgi:hypothetical protein